MMVRMTMMRGSEGVEQGPHLQEARYDVRQQLVERLLGDAFDGLGLHLDGGEVDGVVGRLHDGTQDLDALLRVDGARQRGRRLLRRPDHLYRQLTTASAGSAKPRPPTRRRCPPPCASLCAPPTSS